MAEQIQGIRGMGDVLPGDTPIWQSVEAVLQQTMQAYVYQEIRIPIVERTELFERSIGEVTDIVEKEMYSFADRNGESISLRPEATAGIVRAGISHGLLHNQKQKLWCAGPMFRYEKPQKGRYRQFHQFDVEALGYEGPDIDAELIMMSARIWSELKLDAVELQLNSLGTLQSRKQYRDVLTEYFSSHEDVLDADSRQRLHRNPMRILDSKNPEMEPVIQRAPKINEYLDSASANHFEVLQQLLSDAGIAFTVNPRLVRGLDYYTRTVFEWVTDRLGSQGAICSGGRYDGLVEQLGGKSTPAIGWAIGMERLVELHKLSGRTDAGNERHVYIVAVGDEASRTGFRIAETLRSEHPNLCVEMNSGGGGFKSQFKRADRSGAALALILGEEELKSELIGLKALREEGIQKQVALADLNTAIDDFLQSSTNTN
ncbi:MAG: histidine--tRNA ligase [Gammaproteobacteria bacterium]